MVLQLSFRPFLTRLSDIAACRCRPWLQGLLVLGLLVSGHLQAQPVSPHGQWPEWDQEVRARLKGSIPWIDVTTLHRHLSEYVVLDTREPEEFAISHIPGARHIGYRKLDKNLLDQLDRASPVVVYCSIGYRSEQVGEHLQKLGFREVYNVFGSIFEWANRGLPLHGPHEAPVYQLHTYSRRWSKWVTAPGIKKTW